MGEITLSTAWAWVLAGCAALVSIAKAWEILKSFGKADLRRKLDTQASTINQLDGRLKSLEAANYQEAIRKHADLLAKDEQRLKALEDANVITMKTMLALVQHEIDGNNIEGLKDTRDKLQSYLINR